MHKEELQKHLQMFISKYNTDTPLIKELTFYQDLNNSIEILNYARKKSLDTNVKFGGKANFIRIFFKS